MEIKSMINKKILFTTLLLSITNVANAGFFDSIFGDKEATPATTTEAVKMQAMTKADSAQTEASNSLISTLTQQLGVTDSQAEGGLGSLMQLAQGSLSSGDFSQLSAGVPNMDSLLAAVPDLGGMGISDMLSNAGGIASSLSGLSLITEQFEALGLSSDMISQFYNVAMSYFSKEGGTGTSDLLQKGLSSIMG